MDESSFFGARYGVARLLLVAAFSAATYTFTACSSGSRNDAPAGSGGKGGSAGSGAHAGSVTGESGDGGAAASDGACRPRPCTASVCGVMQDDGCGKLVECSCPDVCVPKTCASEGADCGNIEDGCGKMLACGSCQGQDTCGGSGIANHCGCTATTCKAEGRSCGQLSDGCGHTLDCGGCANGCACSADGTCQDADVQQTERLFAHTAVSSGFTGTDSQYEELYDVSCFSADDCVEPCRERDGTKAMCEASTCVEGTTKHCLPATVWTRVGALDTEGTDIDSDCAELVVWPDPYRDFLRATDFKFEIPEAAEIVGITVTVRRAAGSSDEATDAGIHLIKGGVMGSADRSSPLPWTGPDLVDFDYGGPTDLWNETWTPADVNAPDFGVALSAQYTQDAGNGRAYVDIVYARVSYKLACE